MAVSASSRPNDYRIKPIRRRQLGEAFALVIRGGTVEMIRTAELTPGEMGHRDTLDDIEGLAVAVADNYLRSIGAYKTDGERQDLIAKLVGDAYAEAKSYQPVEGMGSLGGYLKNRLGFRCSDWFRRTYGDERKVAGPMANAGRSQGEIDGAIQQMRSPFALDAQQADVIQAMGNEDPELALLFEDGIKARADYESLMEGEDPQLDIDSIEDAGKALGIDPWALSDEAIYTLVNITIPRANNESWVQISEDTGLSRKKIDLAVEQLASEIKEQSGESWE